MATLKNVQDKVAEIKEHLATELAEVTASVNALKAEIVKLKAALENGNLVKQEDLDALAVSLGEIDQGVRDIITPPVEPPPA